MDLTGLFRLTRVFPVHLCNKQPSLTDGSICFYPCKPEFLTDTKVHFYLGKHLNKIRIITEYALQIYIKSYFDQLTIIYKLYTYTIAITPK